MKTDEANKVTNLIGHYNKLFESCDLNDLCYEMLYQHKDRMLNEVYISDDLLAMQYAFTLINREYGYFICDGNAPSDIKLKSLIIKHVTAYFNVNNLSSSFDKEVTIVAAINFFFEKIYK